jgi:hypothetical protein
MPTLTRRRSTDAREECWHIYYGDMRVGTIARRVGNPFDSDPWECTSDTAETFDQARSDFEAAWMVFLSKRTEGRLSGMARSAGLDG